MPITSRSSSTSTRTRLGVRSATIATECASTGSDLRPLPVANTRPCADSFRRHVEHSLPVVHQPMRNVFADPIAALNCPHSISEATASEYIQHAGREMDEEDARGRRSPKGREGPQGSRTIPGRHAPGVGHRHQRPTANSSPLTIKAARPGHRRAFRRTARLGSVRCTREIAYMSSHMHRPRHANSHGLALRDCR
jgi:hypothetical protein